MVPVVPVALEGQGVGLRLRVGLLVDRLKDPRLPVPVAARYRPVPQGRPCLPKE